MNIDVNIKMCICVICYVTQYFMFISACLSMGLALVYQKNTSENAFIHLKILCAPGNVQHSAASQLHQ